LGIEALARAGRISAASAMVTTSLWADHGDRLAALRGTTAIGLHLNLTEGAPLGAMPRLAPSGRLPSLRSILLASMTGRIERAEVHAEAVRQIECFRRHCGFWPDYVDGHQHVHALPGVGSALISAIREVMPAQAMLVRNPADRMAAILARGRCTAKSLLIAGLTRGFAAQAARAGLIVNDGFSGVSDFAVGGVAEDFASLSRQSGRFHIAMCHPGCDETQADAPDALEARRAAECAFLMSDTRLAERIWRVERQGDALVDWRAELGKVA